MDVLFSSASHNDLLKPPSPVRVFFFRAMAAHDCFNSEWFWSMMRDLSVPDVEPFTITPNLRSSYDFARHPKQEKETVFVNRYFFG